MVSWASTASCQRREIVLIQPSRILHPLSGLVALQKDIDPAPGVPVYHRPAPEGDFSARRDNRELRLPLLAHVKVALPKLPGKQVVTVGVVDAES